MAIKSERVSHLIEIVFETQRCYLPYLKTVLVLELNGLYAGSFELQNMHGLCTVIKIK